MQRSLFPRWAVSWLPGMIILALTAGCTRHSLNPAPPAVPVAVTEPVSVPTGSAASVPPAAFQPYTLLPAPPPTPPVVTPRHHVLLLTRVHQHIYLADSDRHLYEAGRDAQGHIYPIYRDPATHVTYPLYYDSSRDNLYRLARSDNQHFYRNYVGQPTDKFYDTDRDYERISPSDQDRPIVTDSYNTYNYNTYNYGPSAHRRQAGYGDYRPYNEDPEYGQRHPYYTGYRPPATRHSSHFNYNWLWAIPVIVGAYLLLHPHHSNPPVYRPAPTVIVRQSTPVIINNTINNTIISQAAPIGYRPIASPRPVYLYPAGYRPQSGYTPPSNERRSDIRPHGPIRTSMTAPRAASAVRAALVRPKPRPVPRAIAARPKPRVVHSTTAAPRPTVQVSRRIVPVISPVNPTHHAVFSERRHRLVLAPHPSVRPRHRPIVHSITAPVRAQERPRIAVPRVSMPTVSRPRPVPLRTEPAKPFIKPRSFEPKRTLNRPVPIVRPPVIVHPAAARHSPPRTAPPVERSAPPRPLPVPSRPTEVRPRLVKPAPSPPKHDPRQKRPEAPKKNDTRKKEGAKEGDHSARR